VPAIHFLIFDFFVRLCANFIFSLQKARGWTNSELFECLKNFKLSLSYCKNKIKKIVANNKFADFLYFLTLRLCSTTV